jgi:hypothetical protein
MIMGQKIREIGVPPALPNAFSGGKKELLHGITPQKSRRILVHALNREYKAIGEMMCGDPEVIRCLMAGLDARDAPTRRCALEALAYAPSVKEDISPAIPAMSERLCDTSSEVRQRAAMALYKAAEHDADISAAAHGLSGVCAAVRKLAWSIAEEEKATVAYSAMALTYAASEIPDLEKAVWVISGLIARGTIIGGTGESLHRAAKKGADVSGALGPLCEAHLSADESVLRSAQLTLMELVSAMGRKEFEAIAAHVSRLSGCEEFVEGARRNSVWYVNSSTAFAALMNMVQEKMEGAA